MKYWFSADHHFSHANCIKHSPRTQFMNSYEKYIFLNGTEEEKKKLVISTESVEKMNKTLINNHNARVRKEDFYVVNGDFCFRNTKNGKPGEGLPIKPVEYIRQLNGHPIFVVGNHDHHQGNFAMILSFTFYCKAIKGYINVCHNPKHAKKQFPINLTGHCHNDWLAKRLDKNSVMINVGCDVHNFNPIDINDILKVYYKFLREEKK